MRVCDCPYVYVMQQAEMRIRLLLGYWPFAWQVRVYTEDGEPSAPFRESPIRGLFVLLSRCFPVLHDRQVRQQLI